MTQSYVDSAAGSVAVAEAERRPCSCTRVDAKAHADDAVSGCEAASTAAARAQNAWRASVGRLACTSPPYRDCVVAHIPTTHGRADLFSHRQAILRLGRQLVLREDGRDLATPAARISIEVRSLALLLSTIVLTGAGANWRTFHARGITVHYPPGWFATATRLTPVTSPPQILAVASYRLPPDSGGADGCQPKAALDRLPPTGAFIFGWEYGRDTFRRAFPPRPKDFSPEELRLLRVHGTELHAAIPSGGEVLSDSCRPRKTRGAAPPYCASWTASTQHAVEGRGPPGLTHHGTFQDRSHPPGSRTRRRASCRQG